MKHRYDLFPLCFDIWVGQDGLINVTFMFRPFQDALLQKLLTDNYLSQEERCRGFIVFIMFIYFSF